MTLFELGWNSIHDAAWNKVDRGNHFPARVIEVHRDAWRLRSSDREFPAQLSGRLRHRLQTPDARPAVGDWVETNGIAVIDILPRQTKLSRKAAGRRTDEQIVAANIDTVFVMSALDNDFSPRRLERYLTLVWEGGAHPVIVLNKADLCGDVPRLLFEAETAAPGVPVYALSAQDDLGLDQLEPHLQAGRTIAVVGSSGVGKSTLINRLSGFDRQQVGSTLDDGRGQHTTTSRNLILLGSGALLIDTPGMREVQLWSTEGTLDQAFEEIKRLSDRCRFSDCRHVAEPGCAVLIAMADGQLSAERYDSYKKLQKELAFLHRKQDLSAELEQKRKWKQIHKANRALQKARRKDSTIL